MSRTMPMQNVPQIAWGTAGRFGLDTPLTYFTLGDGSGTDAGITTVNVQLFDGRDPTQTLNASVGQGRFVLCQLSPAIFVLPQYGDRVLVVTPNSYGTLPGNSTIVAVIDPRGELLFGDLQPGEMVLAPRVGGGRIVGRADGTFEVGTPFPLDHAALAAILDSFINVFLTKWIVAPMDGGLALKTALTTWAMTAGPLLTPFTTTASQVIKVSS